MPIDPERWTNNTKAAFSAATGHAASSNHPELTPAHLLDALLQQQETMTRPLLSQVGIDPDVLAGKVHEQLSRLPGPRAARSPGCRVTPGPSWRRRTRTGATSATTTSRWSTWCWRWPTRSVSPRTPC